MRFVALGDSLTAGIDETPVGTRWADLLAEALAAGGRWPVRYENLAVYGQESHEVRASQLARALAEPVDVASVICGGNDVMKQTSPDVDAFAANLDAMFAALRAANPHAVLVGARIADVSALLPYRERSKARVAAATAACNARVEAVAARHRVRVLDLHRAGLLAQPEMLATDGFHPSVAGQRAIFAVAAQALGDLLAGA